MDFDYIVHVSSVDWPDDEERFEVVYEFYSIRKRHRIRLKTRVPESDCIVDSLTDLWKGADFMEREVYDMMGIRFRRHPDLRRILMPDDYTEGYPLRKDFPVRGKGWRDTFEFLDETLDKHSDDGIRRSTNNRLQSRSDPSGKRDPPDPADGGAPAQYGAAASQLPMAC